MARGEPWNRQVVIISQRARARHVNQPLEAAMKRKSRKLCNIRGDYGSVGRRAADLVAGLFRARSWR